MTKDALGEKTQMMDEATDAWPKCEIFSSRPFCLLNCFIIPQRLV